MSFGPTVYYVWKRSDGYVGSTTYMPRDYTTKTGETSFEHLGKFNSWCDEAIDLIEAERAKSAYHNKAA